MYHDRDPKSAHAFFSTGICSTVMNTWLVASIKLLIRKAHDTSGCFECPSMIPPTCYRWTFGYFLLTVDVFARSTPQYPPRNMHPIALSDWYLRSCRSGSPPEPFIHSFSWSFHRIAKSFVFWMCQTPHTAASDAAMLIKSCGKIAPAKLVIDISCGTSALGLRAIGRLLICLTVTSEAKKPSPGLSETLAGDCRTV